MAANLYEEQLGQLDAVEVVARTADELRGLLQRLGSAGLEQSLEPGKWPARMTFIHLADTEIVFAFRLRQALAEENHVVQTFDQDAWARKYGSLSANEAIEMFAALRRSNVSLIESLSAEEWSKTLRHPERGEMVFRTLVETMAGHDLNHLAQLKRIASRTGTPRY